MHARSHSVSCRQTWPLLATQTATPLAAATATHVMLQAAPSLPAGTTPIQQLQFLRPSRRHCKTHGPSGPLMATRAALLEQLSGCARHGCGRTTLPSVSALLLETAAPPASLSGVAFPPSNLLQRGACSALLAGHLARVALHCLCSSLGQIHSTRKALQKCLALPWCG